MQFLESPPTKQPKRFERQQEALSSPLPVLESQGLWLQPMGDIEPAIFIAARKGVVSMIQQAYWIHSIWLVPWWRPHSRSRHRSHHAEINLRSFHHVGPYRTLIHNHDNVISTSPISEGTYLSQPINDIEIDLKDRLDVNMGLWISFIALHYSFSSLPR